MITKTILFWRLESMLAESRAMFGEEDTQYKVIDISFWDNLPEAHYADQNNLSKIDIKLSMDAIDNEPQACYQLAHESIHLISPNRRLDGEFIEVTNLEEGLATYFAGYYMAKFFNDETWRPANDKYRDALDIVKKMLSINSGIIRILRKKQPIISKITMSDLLSENIPVELAEKLVVKFYQ